MLSRLIFILFTIAFIAYTWLHTGKAKSCQAVNDPKGACNCEATWTCKDKAGNVTNREAKSSQLTCEDDCPAHRNNEFCNNDCPGATTQSEDEKNALCPGRKDRYTTCEHICNCSWSKEIN